MKVLLFTSLYPTSLAPGHGAFIRERSERLAAKLGFDYEVLHPVPLYPPLPGKSLAARLSRLPRSELVGGRRVHYPRYFHLPRIGTGKQARRVARGARRRFRALVARLEPQLVDAQYLYPDACAALRLCEETGLPCIATARGSDVNLLPAFPEVRQELEAWLPKARRLCAVSPALAERVGQLAGCPPAEVAVVPNGVDLERFRPRPGSCARRVVSVGRLVAGKRQALLVEALASEACASVEELVLVGSGPERPRLAALARRLGVADRLRLLGQLSPDAVADELAKGGLFAFPSLSEGWPNAVLEALASGMPVLATQVPGVAEICAPCEAATLVSAEAGAEAWARAIREGLDALAARGADLGEAARGRARGFAWDQSLAVLEGAYAEVLA